jgi:hypothetical protein
MRARESRGREGERQAVCSVGGKHLRVHAYKFCKRYSHFFFLGVLPNSIATSWPVKFSVNKHGRNPVCLTCFQPIPPPPPGVSKNKFTKKFF